MQTVESTPYPPGQEAITRNWKNFASYLEQLEYEQTQRANVSSARRRLDFDEVPDMDTETEARLLKESSRNRMRHGYSNKSPTGIRKATAGLRTTCSPPPRRKQTKFIDWNATDLEPVVDSDTE